MLWFDDFSRCTSSARPWREEKLVTRIQRDTVAYLSIIFFCILMLTWAIPKYTPPYPGYGASACLVPIVSICVMLFMASLSLVYVGMSSFLKKPLPVEEREFPEDLDGQGGFSQVGRVNLLHLAKIMIPSVLFVVAIEYFGYLVASFVFLIVLQFLIGSRRWTQMILISIILTAVLYVIMRYGFGVPVPGPQIFE